MIRRSWLNVLWDCYKGMKKTIIILHGWNSEIKRWNNFKGELSKDFKVFLPVLPGFGTKKLVRPWNLNDYAAWLKNFIKEHQIKKPILIGHSFGGMIGIKYFAENNPGEGLILINSAGIPKKNLKKYIGLIVAKTGRLMINTIGLKSIYPEVRKLLYKILREKDYYLARGFLKETMINILNCDLTPMLHLIKVPTLILWGEKDKITSIKHAYILNNNIPCSKLLTWKNGTHGLPFEYYKSVSKAIVKFIYP